MFDGSPPCQGFSTAGARKFDDGRNQLFLEFLRLLRAFAPKAFVMENVRGMVIGKMRLIFAEIIKQLKDAGYTVSARILVAGHYGVPQMRPRMILVGIRSDLAALGVEPSHPTPFAIAPTVREAWHGLVNTPDECAVARFGENRIVHRLLFRMKPASRATSTTRTSSFMVCIGSIPTSRARRSCATVAQAVRARLAIRANIGA
ncbi:DNA cytosine methyltransferase [Caballeronia cordobensis]|uniref:DNA cytosine methyltransferase n=1 Tax=Caballeronia cordobensis TaxID=1353886 RepID=UPI00045EE05A|nr:cytosine-specific methyltransferase [Burkholderia sp. RPE67]